MSSLSRATSKSTSTAATSATDARRLNAQQIDAKQLYRVAFAAVRRRLGGEANLIEDLVQESLARAFQGLEDGSFEGRSELVTWVTSIARHVALDSLRSRQRENASRADNDGDIADAQAPVAMDGQIEARSTLAEVARLLNEMNSITADIVFLHDICDIELGEIARSMQMTFAAVQSRLVRGRKSLATRLRDTP